MEDKNHYKKVIFKQCFSVILGICTALLPSVLWQTPQAFAQKAPTSNCSVLEDSNAQKDKIITVLEESIGNQPQAFENSTAEVINCMRVTTCEDNGKPDPNSTSKTPKIECTSKYKELANCPSDAICQRVQVFIAQSGIDLLFGYLGTIYRWLAGIIGVVCVLYIVWGGVMIAVSGDNSSQIDEQKTKILQSIAGLIILFLSSVILATINPNFFKF